MAMLNNQMVYEVYVKHLETTRIRRSRESHCNGIDHLRHAMRCLELYLTATATAL